MLTRFVMIAALLVVANLPVAARAGDKGRPPNIILILTDDQGYGDVGCFGAKQIKTPNLDRMAREGMRFTSFYVTEAVCSASRASILTGSYAVRVGMQGALNHTSRIGISDREPNLARMLQRRGYRTALFGKWHLGHHAQFHPLRHGFDEFVGTMFPNDCSNQFHPIIRTFPPFTVYEGEKAILKDPDQSVITPLLTKRAVDFIGKNKDQPFFLYLAHIMPHVPIHPSTQFRGKSAAGAYGDVIEELDASVGAILAALQANGLDDNTLIIFTSDNGPFLSYGNHAGSAGRLRGGKLTAFEGGVRMPCIMRWTGHIPAGRDCAEIVSTIDLLPTLTRLVGGEKPALKIDGKDIGPLMSDKAEAKSPHEAFFFYNGSELHALRSGSWKLHFPHPYLEVAGAPGKDGKPSNFDQLKPESIKDSSLAGIASRHGYKVMHGNLALYNLDTDIGESKNVADQHPDVVGRLQALGDQMRRELGDSLTGIKGTGNRSPGKVGDQETGWHPEKQKEAEFTGRKLEVFQHGSKKEWGYAAPQRDTFLVLHPQQPRANAPLYVVLHSAGHDVHSCLACTAKVGNHDIYHAPPDFFALYLDCRANKGDWWWGINKYPGPDVSPTEKRVLDTVQWVIQHYGLDKERVYLCGNSMGGSGTLGIGMRHGNVFAAIKANVPAEVKHVSSRMYFPPQTLPVDVTIPDPPIVIDYSAPNDGWSRGHDTFVKAMNERKYALMLYWGPFGHANNHANIKRVNDLIDSFDWLSIKKNEAYPVFTDASTNDPLPWPNQLNDKKPGQINAFFHWQTVRDTPDRIDMVLFLVKPAELKTAFTIPSAAAADVSLRRLQNFRIAPGAKVYWTFGANGGEVQGDATGIITIPRLTMSAEPASLIVRTRK